ncbi:MAG: response regulator [Bermanella sp.]
MDKTLVRTGSLFFGSLAFKIPLLFIIMLSFMMGTFLWVMENHGKPLLLNVAKQQLRETGESIVAVLSERLALTASLVTSMANSAEALPKDAALYKAVIKRQLDYLGTEHFIAGGGVWPEPYAFARGQQRHSFFWGRDRSNHLQYFNDYNLPEGNGYHHEEWYVPGRYVAKQSVYWSRSYMDPYSLQAMVTATAPMYRDDQFYGVATVDIKLEGLTELLAAEAKKFKGYAYALDRNGTFLSFPDDAISKRTYLDENQNEIVEYLNIGEVAKTNESIPNIIATLSELENISKLNSKLIQRAQEIAASSYQIELTEAHRIISVIADPFKHKGLGTTFIKEVAMAHDPILKQAVLINVFHVPNTYWKVVTVTPTSVVGASSDQIKEAVVMSFVYVLGVGLLVGFIYLYHILLSPLQSMYRQLKGHNEGLITGIEQGELGALARQYNKRSTELLCANQDLEKLLVEAQQASVAKTHFLANMSHEIRTPMNGVLGMLNILVRGELNSQQLHYVQVAKSSADSLLILINDILDFSKIEAGKLDIEEIEFDLRSLLCEFTVTMAHLVHNKGLELVLDINDLECSWVKGDPGRIRQVLTNLVSNAIKFTEDGEILIKVAVKDAGDMGLVLFACVKDTGIGIPKAKQAILFESFSQVDASTTRQYGGSGLGLAICKQLCELMDGSISVFSEMGKGSSFEFTASLQKGTRTMLEIPQVNLRNKYILLVDDNQTNLLVLSELLQGWGAVVSEAIDGREALQIMHKHPPFDAVILDMQMPFMDGEQLGRQIREQQKWDEVALIMMTSKSERGDAKHFADMGFAGYLTKPVVPADVHDALMIALEGGAVLAQAEPLVTHHHLETLRGLDSHQALTKVGNLPRLLLVEDNIINQEVALNILGDLGYQVEVAENGRVAIEMLVKATADSRYDAILMDCQMPVMDGYECTQQIRGGHHNIVNHAIPIIAMTANAMKGDREKCLQAGMDDYLAKPIDMLALQEKLKQWLAA